MLKEFKGFILRGNVVELAVAVIIGAAFAKVVAAAVDLLTNLLAIPGKTDFSRLKFEIGGGVFLYGAFLNAVIGFVVVATLIFFVVVRPMGKLAERRNKPEAVAVPPARPEDVVLLEEIRDLLRPPRAG